MDVLTLLKNSNFEHSRQVAKISRLMADKAGYSHNESQMIEQAALYHDIGKAVIPAAILNKPGALTFEEYEIVKTHAAVGGKQIEELAQVLTVAALIARQHHEHENGCGYYHLSGDDIHPYAKLVAVADVFDALYSRRAYKEPWSIGRIRDYFDEQAGKQFDKNMILLFFNIMDEVLRLYTRNDERDRYKAVVV